MKYYAKDQFRVLYEDNHLLIVEKPSGLLTQPDPKLPKISLEELAKDYLCNTHEKAAAFLHVVHRLDKEVSGIVLFAKTSKALSRLNEEVRNHRIVRHYLALVEGNLLPKSGTLEHFLIHASHKAVIGREGEDEAKRALLHYEVIQGKGNTSLVKVTLETGRYHQIRAQLAHIGHPIVGDTKYGAKSKGDGKKIFLHHYHLGCMHPVKKVYMNVTLIPKTWIE